MITLVKKLLEDGSECKKCREVSERLQANDEMKYIDRIVFADERNPDSEGFKLAQQFNVDLAPFFIVEHHQQTHVYTSYFEFRKKELRIKSDKEEETDAFSSDTTVDDDLYLF